ncbi:DUF2982 domain-containing protein [uncultured Vibrio sp.]|uniref:DUF2982 domain-containing protein n=1 Tax=uncultured Vibrio sp. TaxID=114054 RepID=UPI0009103013|nr:DUF2982 domain-containing protein [uncultured Vibrio sp.]OIQ26592.1 MAG: hypothetical protein BM561_02260 [Vibrio sp. MedPE-SWchi]
MPTLQLSNFDLRAHLSPFKPALFMAVLIFLAAIYTFLNIKVATLVLIITLAVFTCSYVIIQRSKVSYTITATHFQQHLYRGGWVIKWSDVERIGLCELDQDGFQQSLPWIGIKLKDYAPYLNSICPRVTTDILLSQRSLLYVGYRNHKRRHGSKEFEDLVLDSNTYKCESGESYSGLRAMLANRMSYQRAYFDYDIFISTSDLDRDGESFVGLTRRYLAAAEPEKK